MDLNNKEKNDYFNINIPNQQIGELLFKLSTTNIHTYGELKEISSSLKVNVIPFLTEHPNFMENNPEIGFVTGDSKKNIVLLYKDFFMSFGENNILSYYSTVRQIEESRFECTYFEIKYSLDDTQVLKSLIEFGVLENQKKLEKERINKIDNMVVSTTPTLENYKITNYYGIVSAFSVLKLDVMQEFMANMGDAFGGKSTGYAKKYNDLQDGVEKTLKYMAIAKGGNAVVGASFDVEFIETSTGQKRLLSNAEVINRKLLISGSGTSVSIEKITNKKMESNYATT